MNEYFMAAEAEKYAFYKVPKVLFTDDNYILKGLELLKRQRERNRDAR